MKNNISRKSAQCIRNSVRTFLDNFVSLETKIDVSRWRINDMMCPAVSEKALSKKLRLKFYIGTVRAAQRNQSLEFLLNYVSI